MKHRIFWEIALVLKVYCVCLILGLMREKEEILPKTVEVGSGTGSGETKLLLLGCWGNHLPSLYLAFPFPCLYHGRILVQCRFADRVLILNTYSTYKSFKWQRNANIFLF